MKFKGNQSVPETVHPEDQQPVVYPKGKKYPEEFKTLEEANRIESDEGDPADAEGGVPHKPPLNNVLPFHKPVKRRIPRHNM